jgi:hypothetical protein
MLIFLAWFRRGCLYTLAKFAIPLESFNTNANCRTDTATFIGIPLGFTRATKWFARANTLASIDVPDLTVGARERFRTL